MSTETPNAPEVKAPLTMEDINKWSGEEMRKNMNDPTLREQIDAAVANSATQSNPSRTGVGAGFDNFGYPVYEKSTREAAAEAYVAAEKVEAERLVAEAAAVAAAEKAAADKAAADKAAADKAEADRLVAEAATREAAERTASKRIVREYQVKDENGNPIGRPTHLEANTWEEMAEKIELAHTNAVRYAERLKRQKLATKAPEPVQVSPGMSEEELVRALQAIKEKNPQEAISVVKKFIDVDKINETIQEANTQTLKARQAAATYGFLTAHRDDYVNNEANATMLKSYIDENKLDWTLENLELAFADLGTQLVAPSREPEVEVQEIVSAPPAANPPVVQPPAPPVEVTKVPTAQEVAEQVLEKLIRDNPSLLDSRRGVNGGIQPGSMSGVRPTAVPAARLTYEEVRKWTPEQMRLELRKPGRAAEIKAVIDERNANPPAESLYNKMLRN